MAPLLPPLPNNSTISVTEITPIGSGLYSCRVVVPGNEVYYVVIPEEARNYHDIYMAVEAMLTILAAAKAGR